MLQRFRHNSQPLPAEARPAASDPWKAAGEPRGSDQGVWILSYLDVMMILFAFFVLLFAFQKAQGPASAEKPESAPSHAAAQSKPQPAAETTTPAGEAAESVLSAMRAQSPLNSASRPASQQARSAATPAPQVARDTVAAAARLAAAQTGQWITQTLQTETQSQQVEVLSVGHGVRLELSESILFDPASTALKGGGEALLDRVLPILQQQPGIVFVEGHTDNTPIANARYPSNWELSTARATAVTHYLIARGVASERIRAVGMADTHPRAGNDGPEGRARNRRVTLVLGDDPPARQGTAD